MQTWCGSGARPTSPSRDVLIELLPLTLAELQALARGDQADLHAVAEGGQTPRHVAQRALALLQAGCAATWAVPFHIVLPANGLVVGGCGFKGGPQRRQVEIGYAVAPAWRGCGVASAAVGQLLAEALRVGGVDQVLAQIVPDNQASMAVVSRLGFVRGDALLDASGEQVIEWRCSVHR